MSEQKNSGGFFQGLIMGAVLGAGAFYFLTQTKEGKKIKARIKAGSEDVFDNLTDLIEEFESKGEEFRLRAKNFQSELEKKLAATENGEAEDAEEKISQIDKLRKRGRLASKKFFTRKGKPLTS